MAYKYQTGESTPPVRLGPVHYKVPLLLAIKFTAMDWPQATINIAIIRPLFVQSAVVRLQKTGMYLPPTYKRYSYHTCGDKGRLYNASLLCGVISTHHTDALGLHYTTCRHLFKQ